MKVSELVDLLNNSKFAQPHWTVYVEQPDAEYGEIELVHSAVGIRIDEDTVIIALKERNDAILADSDRVRLLEKALSGFKTEDLKKVIALREEEED